MYKKFLVPLILALVAALALGGVAYAAHRPQSKPAEAAFTSNTSLAVQNAQDGAAARLKGCGLGQITAIGDQTFSVVLRRGAEKVLRVDQKTRYYDAHGAPIGFADLQVGRWVAGKAIQTADGLLARWVVQLPEGFDPNVPVIRHAGTVTGVDAGASTFTLNSLQGEALTFQVDENTVYMGQVYSLADLQPEMGAVVAARQLDDGSYLAVRVTAKVMPQIDVKAAGKVTGIDTSSFTILGGGGQSRTFQVTPATRFRGLGVKGLGDLQIGMKVGVAAQEGDGGQLKAVLVIVRKR